MALHIFRSIPFSIPFCFPFRFLFRVLVTPYSTLNTIVSNSYDPKRQNENSDKHQLMIKYQLSTPDNVDVVQMINFTVKKKTSIYDPHLTQWDKFKILKPYCTSTRPIYPIIF